MVNVSDAASGIPSAESEVLRAAGVALDGSPTDPSGAAQVAVGMARCQRFRDEALTVAAAARALGVSESRVRQLIAARAVMTISTGEGGHLLPAWQFAAGRLLPGLREIIAALPTVHPLTLAGFMTRPDPDLEVDGEVSSPAQWLVAGGDPDRVADLAAALGSAA